jgi:hypothetical protein
LYGFEHDYIHTDGKSNYWEGGIALNKEECTIELLNLTEADFNKTLLKK